MIPLPLLPETRMRVAQYTASTEGQKHLAWRGRYHRRHQALRAWLGTFVRNAAVPDWLLQAGRIFPLAGCPSAVAKRGKQHCTFLHRIPEPLTEGNGWWGGTQ